MPTLGVDSVPVGTKLAVVRGGVSGYKSISGHHGKGGELRASGSPSFKQETGQDKKKA